MTRDWRAGFSLIEAMVALIVASLCLIAAFQLQQAFVKGEARAEHALMISGLQTDATVLLTDLNPSLWPAGEAPLAAGRRLRWTSAPITGPRQGQGYPAGAGRFEVRLYRVQGDILEADGRLMAQVAFDRMGWRAAVSAATAPAPTRPSPPQPAGG